MATPTETQQPDVATDVATDPAPCGCDGPAGSCEINEVFDLLSRAHMLDILHIFLCQAEGPLRFKDIQERMEISPNTLSERLKDLVAAGLVERESFQEIPPRVEYEATQMATELLPAFDALGAWADRHALVVR